MGKGGHIRTRWHTVPGLRRSRCPAAWMLAGALGLSFLSGDSSIALAQPVNQQVYSFADIMAALTIRLPTGQTVTNTQPLTLQEAVRSLTLEQAVRTPANVARIAGVMIQVRRDETTRTAIQDGIATALDSLVTTGQIAPLGRDLMLEQVSVALGVTHAATTSPPPADPASPAATMTTNPTPPHGTPAAPSRSAPLPPPELPVIAAPASQPPPVSQTPTLAPPQTEAYAGGRATAHQQPPVPRAAPVTPATLATLTPAHLASPTPPPMPSSSTLPSSAPPYAAQASAYDLPDIPAPPTSTGVIPGPAALVASGGLGAIPAGSTVPSPWLGLGPVPGQALFPAAVEAGTLMDLPAEVTAPPATVADSGS